MNWRSTVRTSLLYLVAIAAGFAISYLVVAFVVFPGGVIPRDVKVPNVAGLNYDEAVQRLAQAGFTGEQGEQRYNSSAPKMTVLEQSPPPGSREGVGALVTLVVSGGTRMSAVPTVTGMAKADAQVLLEKAGFDIGEPTEANSNSARGTVIATRPAAGSQVSVPSTISLVISAGAATVEMPDLVGRSFEAARQTLTQLGMQRISVVYDPVALNASGTVVGQTPVARATILPGGLVQLRVAGEARTP